MSRIRESLRLRFEQVSFYGMLATILIAAVPLKASEPWHSDAVFLLICVFGHARVIAGLLSERFILADPILFLPLIGIMAIAIVQILPILGEGGSSQFATFSTSTLSLDPVETKRFIMRFASYLICGEVLHNYTRSIGRLKMLAGLVIVIAAASVLGGVAWQLLTVGISEIPESLGYPQFSNRNHFAYLMEMGLGLLVGILVKYDLQLNYKLVFSLLSGLFFVATIFSQSRGGIASELFIGVVAIFVYFFSQSFAKEEHGSSIRSKVVPYLFRLKKGLSVVLLTVVFLSVAFFAIAFIGGDPVVSRISKIEREFEGAPANELRRVDIWETTFKMISVRPIIGIGFGAYPAAITAFDETSGKMELEQAHNEYLDLVANGGILALLLALIFLFQFFARLRLQLASEESLRKAIAFGAGLGVLAVILHNSVEFGLRPTLNSLIFVVLVVLCVVPISGDRESRMDRKC